MKIEIELSDEDAQIVYEMSNQTGQSIVGILNFMVSAGLKMVGGQLSLEKLR